METQVSVFWTNAQAWARWVIWVGVFNLMRRCQVFRQVAIPRSILANDAGVLRLPCRRASTWYCRFISLLPFLWGCSGFPLQS